MRTPRIPRPRLSYANVTATLALVIATSMGGAYAHGKIGSADIKKNAVKSSHIASKNVKTPDLAKKAVTTNRIKAKAVTKGKLAPSARTRIIMYNIGGHDFAADAEVSLVLPAGVSLSQLRASNWTAQMRRAGTDFWYQIPGHGAQSFSEYKIYVNETNGRVQLNLGSGPGEEYDAIRVFQTLPTEASTNFTLARPAAPRER